MRWDERPRRALVLLKPDRELLPLAAETIDFLQREVELTVMVEAAAAKAIGEVKCTNVRCYCVLPNKHEHDAGGGDAFGGKYTVSSLVISHRSKRWGKEERSLRFISTPLGLGEMIYHYKN